jgi:hypothetical protein
MAASKLSGCENLTGSAGFVMIDAMLKNKH